MAVNLFIVLAANSGLNQVKCISKTLSKRTVLVSKRAVLVSKRAVFFTDNQRLARAPFIVLVRIDVVGTVVVGEASCLLFFLLGVGI